MEFCEYEEWRNGWIPEGKITSRKPIMKISPADSASVDSTFFRGRLRFVTLL